MIVVSVSYALSFWFLFRYIFITALVILLRYHDDYARVIYVSYVFD